MLNLEEFIKTVYHTEKYIVIPVLSRLRIDKTKFIINRKYDINAQNEYLKYIYKKHYE